MMLKMDLEAICTPKNAENQPVGCVHLTSGPVPMIIW